MDRMSHSMQLVLEHYITLCDRMLTGDLQKWVNVGEVRALAAMKATAEREVARLNVPAETPKA
jgi:hypothetical protein